MLFLVIFFTYLGLKKASLNDVAKKLENNGGTKSNPKAIEKVHVWPELVFRELIVMILVTVFLTVWSILLDAPLEEPANPTKTPNPAKAPWYFLGLQEMLVYYDPWIAGVLLPLLIIFGLMAIPYIDTNPKGNGYYTLSERKFAVTTFLFGFLILWVFLIIVGTFLRGPGWNFFSPYEKWDTYKVEPLTNVNLSEILGLNPKSHWIIRELPGFFLLILYFFGLPLILAILKRDFYKSLGFLRFVITIVLLLIMLALPIKMFLTWTINLKYLIVTPWFNI
ncbi:MAG: hypothetical protein A3C43_10195 [Candidatus Schekmanbacteria bacterium RIFCSPHIGHO2_02_FULL_38_11]|uniref:Cytochrome b/b6 C-terminal region profile domain-containing protein n=1 Tax=Candidatus Schekmanbacteria bacterium RIFCSPLOWO2_12_FULL_38_15 TaxID=1817883 RepID=A0A1F7SEP2_9BACT|nr:MAG: hypothetical protein A3C43_10195 [Candidatus Schekmanbacteria bacterium RIFCSPHIGHO2_02_FULL_38_11]OGL49935.1 MAG: hypothetical protein A3H37_09955 [Candidatus Schekmanbacteria bacterium RIFCSPLOWO2_02_FULL_38_14]OGL52243.1 MAG: hypothetical protein A3G31_02985 [Candidatus Schekmanbacteria bacterium RIFCSPLOWO2_12_FULL_38_15]